VAVHLISEVLKMKSLVVYDSNYGHTKKIAEAIAAELKGKSVFVSDLKAGDLKGIELLVFGSPIIAWRPAERMGKFLESLKHDQLKGIKAAAFDTRMKAWYSGDAAKKIAKKLTDAGAELITEPIGFYVTGKEGPLLEGEIDRASEWAKTLSP
jgi:flavodoxin